MVSIPGGVSLSQPPVMYDYRNAVTSTVSPSTVHVRNTALTRFFQKYLLQKAMAVFDWKLPKTWDKNYFLYVLYCWGYIAILNTDKFGVICQQCGLKGYNVFYQPRAVIVVNPLLRAPKDDLVIGEKCALLKLQPDYSSIMDLVCFYAEMMALSAETAMVNILNSKLSFVFGAANKAGAESFKKMYDQLMSGNPAAFVDNRLLAEDGKPNWQLFLQNVGQNYIAGDVMADMRKWELQFCTAVGIPNANTDKRERMITDEVNSNNFETYCRADMWLEQLKASMETARRLFGLSESDLSVDWREGAKLEQPVKMGAQNGPADDRLGDSKGGNIRARVS